MCLSCWCAGGIVGGGVGVGVDVSVADATLCVRSVLCTCFVFLRLKFLSIVWAHGFNPIRPPRLGHPPQVVNPVMIERPEPPTHVAVAIVPYQVTK